MCAIRKGYVCASKVFQNCPFYGDFLGNMGVSQLELLKACLSLQIARLYIY